MKVIIPLGTAFVSADPRTQKMVSVKTVAVDLTQRTEAQASVPAGCANMRLRVPSSIDSFSLGLGGTDERLLVVLKANTLPAGSPALQAAIWIVTDNANFADLTKALRFESRVVYGWSQPGVNANDVARAMALIERARLGMIRQFAIWGERVQVCEDVVDSRWVLPHPKLEHFVWCSSMLETEIEEASTSADTARLHSLLSTLLVAAARRGDVEALRVLLERGVSANTSHKGATPLIAAAYDGHFAVVQKLLAVGADPNLAGTVEENVSTTSLSEAITGSSSDGEKPQAEKDRVVFALLNGGADVNGARSDGETCLMRAARLGSPAVVKALLSRGAQISARLNGKTAVDIAKDRLDMKQEYYRDSPQDPRRVRDVRTAAEVLALLRQASQRLPTSK